MIRGKKIYILMYVKLSIVVVLCFRCIVTNELLMPVGIQPL